MSWMRHSVSGLVRILILCAALFSSINCTETRMGTSWVELKGLTKEILISTVAGLTALPFASCVRASEIFHMTRFKDSTRAKEEFLDDTQCMLTDSIISAPERITDNRQPGAELSDVRFESRGEISTPNNMHERIPRRRRSASAAKVQALAPMSLPSGDPVSSDRQCALHALNIRRMERGYYEHKFKIHHIGRAVAQLLCAGMSAHSARLARETQMIGNSCVKSRPAQLYGSPRSQSRNFDTRTDYARHSRAEAARRAPPHTRVDQPTTDSPRVIELYSSLELYRLEC